MHVHIDRARCNGNAACVLEIPDVFELSADGSYALPVINPVEDSLRPNVDAMVIECPTRAISVTEGPA